MNGCVYHVLAHGAERTPDAPAILAPGRLPLTYVRLRRHVDEVVQTLYRACRRIALEVIRSSIPLFSLCISPLC
jgi:hypothetical protein